MTETLDIPADAAGRIDVFAVDLPAQMMERFMARADATDDARAAWPLRAALGADYLDPDGIELVGVKDLAGLGLAGYLSEGLGAEDTDLADHRAALDALEGHVLIARGPAWGGMAQTLAVRPPLTHIATLHEVEPEAPGPALRADSAEPQVLPEAEEPAPPAEPKGSGTPLPLIAGALVLAALLVAALALGLAG